MEDRKPILLQGAMQVEVKHLLEVLENQTKIEIEGYSFYKGTIEDYPVVISETGIGSINSTISTTIGILNFRPEAIINQGIAGSYDENIHRFDVVIGTSCYNTNCYKTKRRELGEGSNPLEWEVITFTDDDKDEKKTVLQADSYILSVAKEATCSYQKGNVHYGILRKRRCLEQRNRPNFMAKRKM